MEFAFNVPLAPPHKIIGLAVIVCWGDGTEAALGKRGHVCCRSSISFIWERGGGGGGGRGPW